MSPTQDQIREIKNGEFTSLSKKQKNVVTETKKTMESEQPPKLPFMTNLYLGSLTIVGLFLLFRMIQK